MRYDNIFWVLIAPALAACACFAFEMSCNSAESWNNRFEESLTMVMATITITTMTMTMAAKMPA